MQIFRSPTSQRSTIAAINIAFCILVATNRAQAQSAEAEKLFNDGNKLMAHGKLAEACAAFEASNRVEPRAGTLLRLGKCRENNQQFASAWSAYKDARNLATDPRKRRYATTKAAELEPRLSYLTVAISDKNQIEGLALTRNGAPFDPVLWNKALPIDGGDYLMTGQAPGYEEWQQTIHVPLERAKLSVDVPALTQVSSSAVAADPGPSTATDPPVASPVVPPVPPMVSVPVTTTTQQNVTVAAPPPPSVVVVPTIDQSVASRQASSKAAPIVSVGAVALLGGGLGFELWAESKYAAAKSEMTSQLRRDSLYNSANVKRYVAEALGASGLATSVAAMWLYLRDGGRERDTTGSTGMRVVPTRTGLALSAQF